VAPGLDVERDVLRQMDFGPRISTQLRIMDERLFREPRMGLQLADRPVARPAS